LINRAEQTAVDLKIRTERGVFVAVPGPNLETRAEYRFLRLIGADAVGMSTVPETIVANHMGLQVLGFSIVTDECFPDALQPASVQDIIAVAGATEPKLTAVMKGVIERL
jgi:purine-nucleoside phosphorylase